MGSSSSVTAESLSEIVVGILSHLFLRCRPDGFRGVLCLTLPAPITNGQLTALERGTGNAHRVSAGFQSRQNALHP
jgi:hypothetical protein